MTDGSLWNKILGFAFPLAFTGILQQLFNAADIAVVGNFTGELGKACMAAVGANTPIISLIVNSFLGISLGTNVVIANAVGKKDDETVQKALHTSMIVAVIGGIIIALIGELLAVPILRSQNISEESLGMAITYFRIYIGGLPVILLYNFEAAVFRGMGNTRIPFVALIISGIINVVLNLFFVVFLHANVEGVATATVISNMISSIILLFFLRKSKTAAKFDEKKLKIDWRILWKILRIGIPASGQAAVFSTANIIIQAAINSLGTSVAAAFGQACTTITGQNYGAKKIDRCKKTLKLCMLEGIVIEGLMVFTLILFGKQLIAIFNPDPELVEIGYIRIVLITSAHLFSLFYDVMSGYMRGYGISLTPAIITMISVCGIRIFWIYTIFQQYHTFESIMTVYPISLGTTSVLMFILLLIWHPAKRFGKIDKA